MAEIFIERPAAVQAGVNAFLEKHQLELRRIRMLPPEEQEQASSALMSREMDRIAKMAPQDRENEIAVLAALETDRILLLNSQRQQKVIAEKYGLSPMALISHYPELQTKSAELRKKLDSAESKTAFMGWTAFLGTVAATLIPFGKAKMSMAERFANGKLLKERIYTKEGNKVIKVTLKLTKEYNKLIKGFFVSLASLAMGFIGSYLGAGLFARKIKDESKTLATDSRVALEREVADAVESKVRADIVAAAAPVSTPAPEIAAGIERKAPPQPREGFAAEAAKEKAAAQAAGAGIG